MTSPPAPERVAQRLKEQFAPAYLTLTSIIQGVALTALVVRVEALYPRFGAVDWVLAVADASATGLRAGGCAACQNRKGDQQGTRSYPRRRSAVSIATSTREVMPGTSTGRRPATWPRIHFGWLSSWCSRAYRSHHGSRATPAIDS